MTSYFEKATGNKPKTLADAINICKSCKRFDETVTKCEILGDVTVKVKHICYLAGYAEWRRGYSSRRREPRYPSSE